MKTMIGIDYQREVPPTGLTTVIAHLPADTTAYCGHGPQTTIGDEFRYNPYLRASF